MLSSHAAAAAKSLQSCLTLCDPIDGSPPGSTFPGISQARTLEWVAISFSNAWKWKVKGKSLSHVWLFMTLWTAAYQAPPSMGFSRQEYWSGVPSPSPGFCHTSTWISHKDTYVPSLLNLPVTSHPTPSHPSRLLHIGLSSLSHAANSHWLSTLHMVNMLPHYSLHFTHPLLTPPPQCP